MAALRLGYTRIGMRISFRAMIFTHTQRADGTACRLVRRQSSIHKEVIMSAYVFAIVSGVRSCWARLAYWGRSTGMLLFAASLSVLGIGIGTAHAQNNEPRFCYKTCHPTLHAAEAELRSTAGDYGSLWKKEKTYHYMDAADGPVQFIRYILEDQPASVMYNPGYVVGGNAGRQGVCAPLQGPHDTTSCLSEQEGVAGMLARKRAAAPSCSIVELGYEGSYGTPYVSSRSNGSYGTLTFTSVLAGVERRSFLYTTWCPGWTAGSPPSKGSLSLAKSQTFDCPAGFQPKYADNPAYSPGAAGLDWPRVCEPKMPPQAIYVYGTNQTESASANCNPCFPATGDKARSEVDFSFAGRDFTRYYHSLGQLQVSPELGANWTHSYSGTVPAATGKFRFTERGYLQTYASGRSNQVTGEALRKLSNGQFELTEASGSRRIYSPQGRLIAVDEGNPQVAVALIYDSKGRLERATDGAGRALVFAYEQSRIASITLPDGSAAKYTYDQYNNLVKVDRPDGSSRTYVYAEQGLSPANGWNLLTGIIEGNVRYATFSYNDKAKVTGSRLFADGQPVDAITISYNADGSATSVNHLGDVRQHTIGGGQFRQITQTVDAQGMRSYGFSSSGRPTSRMDALGNRTTYSYVDSSTGAVSQVMTTTEESIGRVTRTTRDANNRVVEQRVSQKITGGEELTSLNREVYDAQGHALFSCQYDANQNTDYVCGSLATAPINVRQSQNTYCTEAEATSNPAQCPLPGLQLTALNPAGAITRFEYHAANDAGCDANGVCNFRKGDLRAEIDPLGRRTEYLEYDALGRAIQVRGIDGVVVEQLFDHNSRVLAETIKGDVPANDRIRLYEYSFTGKLTRVTQPDGVWTRMHYDTADRLTSVEDAAGNRINYVLDGAGNRLREEVRDSSGVLRRALDRLFDTASRMTRVTGASGQATQLRYDAVGNLLETENPAGTISKSTYDGMGRPTRQIDDLGGINAEMRYGYAANGQVERVVDPKGLATTYGYDGFGQLATQTSPDTGTTQFTYDRLGNPLSRTDARGVTAQYEYDAVGRTAAVRFADPAADIQYVYDQPSSQCPAGERAGVGRLSSMIDSSGRTDYCYSPVGDLVRRVQLVEGQPLVLRYAYAPSGRLQSMTYPDGSLVDYGYNTLGQVSSVGVTPAGGTREVLLQGVQTLPFGPEQSWTFGNGRRLDRSYDLDYRPLAISDGRDGLNVTFGFDDAGNITSLTEGSPQAQGATLDYDALGRLTAFKDVQTGVAIEQYSYDATGNRLSFGSSAGTQTYVYPSDSHRLASVNGVARTYDAMGNTLTIGGEWQYVYDLAGRLRSATRASSAQASYSHNAAGQRILQQTSGNEQLQLHGEAGEWLGNYGVNGVPIQQLVWMDSRPVGLIQAGKVLYLESDHLGSPRTVIDPQRDRTVWSWSLLGEAFGKGWAAEDPDQDGIAQVLDLRFPGQRIESSSGLSYNYFRDYDPNVGRFVQSDPMGLMAGASTYAYAVGDPIAHLDRDGRQAQRIPIERVPTPPVRFVPPAQPPANDPNFGRGLGGALGALRACFSPAGAAILAGVLIPNSTSVCDTFDKPPQCGGDEEDPCERMYYQVDIPTCRGVARARGPSAGARCYAQAAERYGACLSGRPIPPLDTWNN